MSIAVKFSPKILSIVSLIFLLLGITTANESEKMKKTGYSAIVSIEEDKITAGDCYGKVIIEGIAGKADAEIIQTAVDSAGLAGEVRICKGKYILEKSIRIDYNLKLSGEGRGTIFVPPTNDYAFKVEKGEKDLFPRPYHTKEGHPLYAVIFRDITIDGKRERLPNSGKGIFLKSFSSSSFENLWIQNTGNALTIERMHESDFSNIYLINNGDEEKKEPGIFITGVDNLHFSGLYVIYQNYVGLDMLRGKLVFITQSMFHGWLPRHDKSSKYPIIQIKDLNEDKKNEGRFKSDLVIENSRITVGGEGTSVINIINNPVTLRQCVATSGFGNKIINATKNSRVNISDNSFYSLKPLPAGAYVLYAEESEVLFKNNVISSLNLQVCLKGVRNSIIADNRFESSTDGPHISIGDKSDIGSRSIQVRGNIFNKKDLESAVVVSPLCTKNIIIKDNMLGSD